MPLRFKRQQYWRPAQMVHPGRIRQPQMRRAVLLIQVAVGAAERFPPCIDL